MKIPFPGQNPSAHLLPLLMIMVLTLAYTWPLASQLAVAIPGNSEILPDTTETIWSIGWTYQALSSGEDIWHTDRLFVPFGADLRFNVFGWLQGLMAFPFVPILGVTGASNLILIATIFLNGVFAYFIVEKHVQNPIASFIASVCHMLSIAVIWHFTVGRNGLPSLWLISANLLCLKSLLDRPSIWKGFLLVFTLLAAFFTDLHITLFTGLWVFLYTLGYFWSHRMKALESVRIASLLIAGSLFALACFLILRPSLSKLNSIDFPSPALEDAAYYSFSIRDFVRVQFIPYIYGFDFLLAIILAVFLFQWQGEYRFWLVSSLIFLILALGPYLKPTTFPLPYTVMSAWPPLQNFRSAYRFVIPATTGLTVVMGYVLARFLPKATSQIALLLFCGMFILLRTLYTISLEPFKTQDYPSYSFYAKIANEADDYTILEIPFGIRSGFDQIGQGGEQLQYYQALHKKRILNGSLARLPASLFAFYRGHPALMFFSGDRSVEQSKIRDDFLDVLEWSNPKYVLVHRSLLSAEQADAIELFLENQPQLLRIDQENDLVIYKVIP